MSVLHTLTQHLWCPWLLGGFLLTGLVYSFGSGFFPFFHARLWLGTTLGSLFHPTKAKKGGGLSSLQACHCPGLHHGDGQYRRGGRPPVSGRSRGQSFGCGYPPCWG